LDQGETWIAVSVCGRPAIMRAAIVAFQFERAERSRSNAADSL
jgi:hypothetical protein